MTANSFLNKTPNAGNRRTYTISVWVKRSVLGSNPIFTAYESPFTSNSGEILLHFDGDDTLHFRQWNGSSPYIILMITQRKFRDTTAWYHIVAAIDTTQSTEANRVKIYINGTQETGFSTSSYPSQNLETRFNDNIQHTIGTGEDVGRKYFDGQMAHFHFVDGTAYPASTFAETDSTTGVWKPKLGPSVTYGTNGFFLKFLNANSLGADSSGNSNDYSVNGNLKQSNSTPTNKFATFNPRGTHVDYRTTVYQLHAGHTFWGTTGTTRCNSIDMCFQGGKWYWECKIEKANATATMGVYCTDFSSPKRIEQFVGDISLQNQANGGKRAVSYLADSSSSKIQNGGSTVTYGANASDGDIIMMAFDSATGKNWFGINGTWNNAPGTSNVGNPATGANDSGTPLVNTDNNLMSFYVGGRASDSTNRYMYINFGHGFFGTTAVSSANADGNGKGIFEYAPPSGFLALCSENIQSDGG